MASSLTQSHADADRIEKIFDTTLALVTLGVVTGNTAAVGLLKMQKFKVSFTDTEIVFDLALHLSFQVLPLAHPF